MPGRILVGVDGSRGSRRALAWAVEEATARKAVLEAVTVWRGPYDGARDFDVSYPVDEAKLATSARARLAEAIGEVVGERPAIEIQSTVLEGDPAETLCRRAAEADMLVVGSRRHGTFAGLLLGSVGSKCAHHGLRPVVIVPAPQRGDQGPRSGSTGRIVVGVDGSPGSLRALRWAVSEAGARAATVEALMVLPHGEAGHHTAPEPQPAPFRSPARDRATAEHAREHLQRAVAEVVGERPAVEIQSTVLEGDPAETLCRRAAEADMLVVGSRRHGTFAELSRGSVGTACVHRSRHPVVIVPTERPVRGATSHAAR